jgi:hypothetical protein
MPPNHFGMVRAQLPGHRDGFARDRFGLRVLALSYL